MVHSYLVLSSLPPGEGQGTDLSLLLEFSHHFQDREEGKGSGLCSVQETEWEVLWPSR